MTGKLTTHILDTRHGCPAASVTVEVWRIAPSGERTLLKTVQTNQDGRTDAPLLTEASFRAGTYELVFFMGDYFSQRVENLSDPMFLDVIPIRFGVVDPTAHYHIPLLATPWSYTTYRGS
ncbi:MAG: hydroxyisourate hydrolase [Elainella sp.]